MSIKQSRLHNIWQEMIYRCTKPYRSNYHNYGGRGITVCTEWMESFTVFETWALSHGYTDELTLDRLDNNGNYCPENCCWATYSEQLRHTRQNVHATLNGETKVVKDWCAQLGISYNGVYNYRKWHKCSTLEALNAQAKKQNLPYVFTQ